MTELLCADFWREFPAIFEIVARIYGTFYHYFLLCVADCDMFIVQFKAPHYVHDDCTAYARRRILRKTLSGVLGTSFSVSRFEITTFQIWPSKHH